MQQKVSIDLIPLGQKSEKQIESINLRCAAPHVSANDSLVEFKIVGRKPVLYILYWQTRLF